MLKSVDHAQPTPHTKSDGIRFKPVFLECLAEARHCDASSGGSWRNAPELTATQAAAMSRIDRSITALEGILLMLQASEKGRRRDFEDPGIGEDLHDVLLLAARQLAWSCRDPIDMIEGC